MEKAMKFMSILVLAGLFLGTSANALDILEYKEKAVAEVKAKDAPYAYHFYAEWCTICLAQKRAIQSLENDKDLKNYTIFLVDFDFQRKIKAEYGVERQSTIILFRSGQELTRSLAVKEKEKLEEFLKKGL